MHYRLVLLMLNITHISIIAYMNINTLQLINVWLINAVRKFLYFEHNSRRIDVNVPKDCSKSQGPPCVGMIKYERDDKHRTECSLLINKALRRDHGIWTWIALKNRPPKNLCNLKYPLSCIPVLSVVRVNVEGSYHSILSTLFVS